MHISGKPEITEEFVQQNEPDSDVGPTVSHSSDYDYQLAVWEQRQMLRKVAAVVVVAAGLIILGYVFGSQMIP